ncbi:hypothetical protein V1264_008820 [Littorina saxatilis]|uniref:J domain-containing protein n=1 Tax=Littorina saxatilis TaxID=31220 RepID=A0AAN9AQX9_9CAEN
MAYTHIRERKRCLEVLGLTHSASEEDVRKAYRTLALQFHPDKNKSDNATERFQEIQGAYKYLREGPGVVHMHEDSDDDDDGIPIFILIRLFPWLFSGEYTYEI